MRFFLPWRSSMVWRACGLAIYLWFALLSIEPESLWGQSEKSKTATYVKVHAIANKPGAGGVQTVTVTLGIDKDYFLIGNKVPQVLTSLQLKVSCTATGKLVDADFTYPQGSIKKNELEEYSIYQDEVVITGVFRSAIADNVPIEAVVAMQGYPLRGAY